MPGGIVATSMSAPAQSSPLLSVIIPAYNAEKTIERCLLSLARQTIDQDKIEVILVDDASTDSTSSTAEKSSIGIRHFRYVRQTHNKKQGAARNLGIDICAGRYLTFLDADDYLRLDALESALFHIKDADCLLFQHVACQFGQDYRTRRSNRRLGQDAKLSALSGETGWWPFGILVRSDIVKYNHIRFAEGVYFEDIDFVIDLFGCTTKNVVIEDALYYYVQGSNSVVNSISEEKLNHSVEAVRRNRLRLGEQGAGEAYVDAFESAASLWLVSQGRRIAAQHEGAQRDRLFAIFAHRIKREFPGSRMAAEFPSSWEPPKPRRPPRGRRRWTGEFETLLSGKVVFFCEVDYHIRTAVGICRQLSSRLIPAAIVDASASRTFTASRTLTETEKSQYSDVKIIAVDVSEKLPYSSSAAAFVFQNDLTYTSEIIYENFGVGVPTVGLYEGINDDLNADRPAARRPYRSVDYLLLPGEFQSKFYTDRKVAVVGLANIGRLWSMPFPRGRIDRAIINVNFTYGVLEDRRDEYVRTAVEACAAIGLPYVISQHPADKADLGDFNVSTRSIYELLSEGGVLVSRFSTTLLEGMALGRAVIYYNPIGERVEKFQEPLGAYQVACSKQELVAALQAELDLGLGTNRRDRSVRFLDHHCNIASSIAPEDAAAAFIAKVVAAGRTAPVFKARFPGPEPKPAKDNGSRARAGGGRHSVARPRTKRGPIADKGPAWPAGFVARHRRVFGGAAIIAVVSGALAILEPFGAASAGPFWALTGLAVMGAASALGLGFLRKARRRRKGPRSSRR